MDQVVVVHRRGEIGVNQAAACGIRMGQLDQIVVEDGMHMVRSAVRGKSHVVVRPPCLKPATVYDESLEVWPEYSESCHLFCGSGVWNKSYGAGCCKLHNHIVQGQTFF
jgi:hypothetical protein